MAGGRISGLIVARGAASALIVAVPAAFFNGVLSEQDPKPQGGINFTFLLVVLGFLLGGWVAGREATTERAKHGALAGVLAFVPVEAISILARLDRGDPVGLGNIIFLGLLAACAGTAGAQLAARRRARRGPT